VSQDVPHPALPFRRYARAPLAGLAPRLVHPQLGRTVTGLLAACPDELPLRRWLARPGSLHNRRQKPATRLPLNFAIQAASENYFAR